MMKRTMVLGVIAMGLCITGGAQSSLADANSCRQLDFAEEPPSDEASAAPAREEWPGASSITVEGLPPSCTARRIREWLRISCDFAEAVEVVGGTTSEVEAYSYSRSYGMHLVAPVRRGDRRVVQVIEHQVWWWSRWAVSQSEHARTVLNVTWLEGEAAPTVFAASGY